MNRNYMDPRWQQFRLKRLEQSDWKCDHCGNSDSTLHVHHTFYLAGRKPWEYLPGTTLVLCEPCHELIHAIERDFKNGDVLEWENSVAQFFDGFRNAARNRIAQLNLDLSE